MGAVSAESAMKRSQGKSLGVEGTSSSGGSDEAGVEVMPRGVIVPTLTGVLIDVSDIVAERMSMEPMLFVPLRRPIGAN